MRLSELPGDLVGDIFSRVPLESLIAVRSTCRKWNELSKNHMLGKATRKQFRGFVIMDYKVCFVTFDLQGIRYEASEYVSPSIKEISVLDKVEAYRVSHCDGLLLCESETKLENSKLVLWNPYLGQTSCVQEGHDIYKLDMYALGYDNNRNHKILKFVNFFSITKPSYPYKIYEFSSDSWRDVSLHGTKPNWDRLNPCCVSLKGNTYFLARNWTRHFLLCFDFTAERFGQRLSLPFKSSVDDILTQSCVREEQLAVLCQRSEMDPSIGIWVTNMIAPNAVSWSKFFNVNITSDLTGFPVKFRAGSFFIDEEEKVAVVFDLDAYEEYRTSYYQTAHIIGQDGYIKSVIGDAQDLGDCRPLVFSSYVPSLVQLQINRKRKARGYY
ncbi:hypothetical protein CARUB_v10015188mg [Capsella rubella]|uniref:F-box domain-containing protein n=1 Tax=Capsella rubella TaxID=81985 RepID=R0G2B6_9BRAS|nr:F-box/kelch-repeat protein At3g13680 [Capsella rubella]EOA29542.1 hypothetical protein CARUB_v10015188mg [Capsella rubella]